MKNINKLVMASIIGVIVTSGFANTKTVGTAKGFNYNRTMGVIVSQELTVYVDDGGYVYFKAPNVFGTPKGYVSYSDYKEVVKALKKSLEWGKKSKQNELTIKKEICTFYKVVNYREQGIGLDFVAINRGLVSYTIINIKDFSNRFYEAEIWMSAEQVKSLMTLLDKVPLTHQSLVIELKKADILN